MRMHAQRMPVFALFALVAIPSFAQVLEEVIVTAQKREQNLQEVPISIIAISGDDIFESGYGNMEDLSVFVPNLFMSDSLTGQNLVMRGIGTTVANEAFEQAVAQFHDGVYYGRDNLSQNTFFDLERVEVVRGPAPVFAGMSATAGALSYISRRPGAEPEGYLAASYGSDEELSVEGAFGGPITDSFSLRFSGRYYELGDTGYNHVLTGADLGTKEDWGARLAGVWAPTENFELMFKYERHDVKQIGVPTEYTRCETRPALSFSHPVISPFIGAPCALDSAYNGIDLTRLDGKVGSGGSQDVRAVMDTLNASAGANFGEANYWGAPFSPVSRGLNEARIFNEEEQRTHEADMGVVSFDWDIAGSGIVLTSITSYVEYEKRDMVDPDMSSFAIFADERTEDFEQFSQEIRIASPEDQRFAWMVGGYYQDHDLTTQIDVYLPWLFDIPNFLSMGAVPPNPLLNPAVHRAISFGGPLVEDSSWFSAFFSTTFSVTDSFRINIGGRYQDIEKDGVENPQLSLLPVDGTEFGPAIPFVPPVSASADSDDFLPEVGIQWDMGEEVMLYAKYAEALKAGGFVKAPPVTGAAPDPFTYEPEKAEGWEVGLKGMFLSGRLAVNLAIFDTDFEDLQVVVFDNTTGQFITQNAASSHSKGIEIDGRWAVTENFSLTFAAQSTEAEYDEYAGAQCNSFDTKLAIAANGGNPLTPCFVDASGEQLPFAPEWSASFTPEYRATVGNFSLTATANMVFSDGFRLFGVDGDPIDEVSSWERIDLRLALSPLEGNWEVAVYGRDVTDERLQTQDAFEFLSKSNDLIYDAGGVGRERGARYGVQFRYTF